MEINQLQQPNPATEYDKDIAVAKEMSRLHLWRDIENQHANFTRFIVGLCAIRDVPAPTLDVDPACPAPHYVEEVGENRIGHIYLDKYSVISMLHELGHHFGGDESECKLYSEWVFAHAFPVSFSRLERDARGFLCKPGTGTVIAAMLDTNVIMAQTNTETM